MKLETHLHTKSVSQCAQVSEERILELYLKKGYGAAVVTDHYTEYMYKAVLPRLAGDPIAAYLSGYNRLKQLAVGTGLKVLLGMELALAAAGYQEFLLYGISEEFLRENPKLFELTQKQLFRLCEKNRIFLVQAHPFRKNIVLANPLFLHGVEVYNGNRRHDNHNRKALNFADKNMLTGLSGSDFHQEEDLAAGGIIAPPDISSESALAEYLFNNKPQLIKNGRTEK